MIHCLDDSLYQFEKESIEKQYTEIRSTITEFQNLKIDNDNIESKFQMLTFKDFWYDVKTTGNIEVGCNVVLESNIPDGILDGSVKLTVVNNENQPIAIGYYSAPFSENMNDIGFGTYQSTIRYLSALCAPYSVNTVSPEDSLAIIVDPIHMWIIEK